MNAGVIIGLGLLGYFAYRKFSALEKSVQQNQQDIIELGDEKEQEELAPAEKYLKFEPSVLFTKVSANTWVGKFTWKITNTSSNYTFNITRIKSNIIILGYTSLFVPGNKDSIVRLAPGATVTINSTWQNKSWFADDQARTDIQDKLRSRYDYPWPILKCDVAVWCRGNGQVDETKYIFQDIDGTVTLESGAIHNFNNQGEYAGDWVGYVSK